MQSLDKLIRNQIFDNNRKGVGYNALALAPPPTGLFAPPTIDLSSSGLEEFQQPEFEGYGLKANKSVSDNEDEVESPVVVEKKTDVPTIPKVDVVRPKQQEKSVRKTVRYAEMYRSKGNPEIKLEDSVRLNSPEDKKSMTEDINADWETRYAKEGNKINIIDGVMICFKEKI
ncbi:hypothetical protein Tco_0018403 [Tanacetum coccineum]